MVALRRRDFWRGVCGCWERPGGCLPAMSCNKCSGLLGTCTGTLSRRGVKSFARRLGYFV
jgi:hypothetical protein